MPLLVVKLAEVFNKTHTHSLTSTAEFQTEEFLLLPHMWWVVEYFHH